MELKPGYKQTEVGVIPEDWDTPELGDILKSMQLGGNYKNSERETNCPLIKMGNLGRGTIKLDKLEFILASQTPIIRDRLKEDDILFNTRNTLELVGKIAIWRNELPVAYFNSNIMRMEFNETKVASKRFMNYILNTTRSLKSLRAIAIGTTSVAAIYSRDLVKVKIPLPTKAEQTAIASALSDADALIQSLTRLIAKKHQTKQGAMQTLLNPYENGCLKEGWGVKKIGSFTDATAGGTPSTLVDEYWGGDIKWMSSGELNKKRVYDVLGRITEEGLKNSATKIIPTKCVLIGLAGQGKTRGTVAMNFVELCTNQSIAAIFPCTTVSTEFLYFNLDVRYEELRNLSTGDGGRGGLNLRIIKNLDVWMPEKLEEQLRIATILSGMDAEIAALETKLAKYRCIKQGMMQNLLTGRIRLVKPESNTGAAA